MGLQPSLDGKEPTAFRRSSSVPKGGCLISFTASEFSAAVNENEYKAHRHGIRDIVDLVVGDARERLGEDSGDSRFCIAFVYVDIYDVTKDLLSKLWPLARGGATIVVQRCIGRWTKKEHQ